MINVYKLKKDCYGGFYDNEIIARVKYRSNLDCWNGSNWQNGGTGMHKGITRLNREGKPFVIIIGSQWQGDRDYGYIVSDKEALQEILKADKMELLEEKKFRRLKELYKQSIEEEE